MTLTLDQVTSNVREAGKIGQCFDDATKDLDLEVLAAALGMRRGALYRALEKAHEDGRAAYRRSFWVIRYTTAATDYDWTAYTEDAGVAGYDKSDRKPWRKVRVDPDMVEAQADRYMSGMKPCVAQPEFDKLLAYGLVVKE